MNKSIKVELKKSLYNKITMIILIFTIIIVIYQVAMNAISFYNFYEFFDSEMGEGNPMFSSESLFCRWLGADVTSFGTGVFFFLMPLLVALPYGWSLVDEMKSAYTKNILIRVKRRDYFIAKYMAQFVTGAIVVMIPLCVSIILTSMFLPAIPMESIYPYGTMGQNCMWSDIYYTHPYLYMGMYVVLDGIFAGLISTMCTAMAMFLKSKITVVIAPFIIMLVIDYIDRAFLLNGEYSPIKFLQALPVANNTYGSAVALIGIVFFLVPVGCLLYKERKYEVL